MGTLNFQTGKRSYTVNDGATICFDPADAKFASRIILAFKNCSEITKKARFDQVEDPDAMFASMCQLEMDIREEIDKAFGENVCQAVFADGSAISVADSLPVWANFLMAVIDEVDANVPDGGAKASDRVRHYMAKYESKYGKSRRT